MAACAAAALWLVLVALALICRQQSGNEEAEPQTSREIITACLAGGAHRTEREI